MENEPAQDQLRPFTGVAIIRDKDGNPRFDDPHNVPDIIMRALNPKDLEHLNKLRSE